MRSACGDAAELREDVWIERLVPVPEAAPQQGVVGGEGAAEQDEAASVEEIRGVASVRRERLEAWERPERCCGPVPAVPNEVENAPGAGAARKSADGPGSPRPEAHVGVLGARLVVAPRMTAPATRRRRERRAIEFGLA